MATFRIVLDTRSKGKDNRFSLSLRVCFDRKTRFLSLDARYTQEEYNQIFKSVSKGIALGHRDMAEQIIQRAIQIYDSMEVFEYEIFKTLFRTKENNPSGETGLISDLFDEYIRVKPLSISSQKSYHTSRNSLLTFKPNLKIKEINQSFLNSYEDWFCKRSNNKITGALGIYLRSLRAVINFGIQKGVIGNDYQYPFKNHIYTIPVIRKEKETFTSNKLIELISYNNFESPEQEFAMNVWKLQFYCNGINMKDLLLLKWSDKKGKFFIISREKTKRTTRSNPRPVRIPITDKLKAILDKIGKDDNLYVLGILSLDMTEKQIQERKRKFSKLINKHLKVIGEKLGLNIPLVSKTSRDSYATSLMRAGVGIEQISKSIGHSNPMVTQHYLGSFEEQQYFEINSHLP